MAPEMLEGKKWDGHDYGVDVWGFGMIIYTLLFGEPPFQDLEYNKIMRMKKLTKEQQRKKVKLEYEYNLVFPD